MNMRCESQPQKNMKNLSGAWAGAKLAGSLKTGIHGDLESQREGKAQRWEL